MLVAERVFFLVARGGPLDMLATRSPGARRAPRSLRRDGEIEGHP